MGLTRITAQQISNIDYKQSVRAVTTTNITLAGGAPSTADSVSLAANDRVLVTGQTTGSENGLYYVTTLGNGSNGTWTRSTDGDVTGEIDAGLIVMVTEGTVYADTQWKLTTNDPIVVGTTALTFVQNYLANSISAGTSNVSVGSSGNVTISSAGTANVLTVSSTGTVVSGTESVTGNITGGNILTAGLVSATGNIQGGNLRTAGLISATGAVTAASVVGGVITGTSTSVSGTTTAASVVGGVITGTSTSVSGTTTAASVVGGVITGSSVSVTGAVTGASLAGTITTAAQTNITSVGTLSSLTMGGLLTGYSSTNTDVNTANDGGSFSARGNASTIASMTFHRTGAYAINMGLGTDNIFRIGGWSASNNCMQLSGTGAMTILSSLTLNSASGVTAIVNGGSNGVGNIGSSTSVFNTVFAKATSAQYADVAEKYTADADYPVGTVLRIGGIHEVSQTNSYHATNIVGTVSDKPAYVMNSGLAAEHVAIVALLGRVPCRVTGTISKGDLLVSSKMPGVATVLDPDLWVPGCVMGKALEDYDSTNEGTIEIVVGRS
jgi:hypothetical protein